MPQLAKHVLFERVQSAISVSGWRMIIERPAHPFIVRCARDENLIRLRIYIWNVTSGGPVAVRPSGEYRIQITGVHSPLEITPDAQTLLLGWSEDIGVFTAFDPYFHQSFRDRSSPSIQVRSQTLEAAALGGFGFQLKQVSRGVEVVVTFSPDMFIEYVLRQAELHRFLTESEVETLQVAARGEEPPQEALEHVPTGRREVVTTVVRRSRERSFRVRVLGAYSHHCAVCHLQLELVQAAHIIPVEVPDSTDQTSNGLALCSLHHQAYDRSLLTVAEDYHIQVSEFKLRQLQEKGLLQGQDSLRAYVCNTIYLPTNDRDRPHPDYLRRGMEARGWRE